MDVGVVIVLEDREIDEVYVFSSKAIAEVYVDRRIDAGAPPELAFETFEITLDGAVHRIGETEALG